METVLEGLQEEMGGRGGGLSGVLSYCSLSKSIDLDTESLWTLCSEPPAVLWDSRLQLMSGWSLS